MGLIKSTDDFEILDGLKQNAGKKKQMGGYAAIANLQVPQRFDHENMCPVAMVISKVVEKQKMLRVYAGVDPATGKIVEEDFCSIGAQLRGLLNPDGTGGRIIQVSCARHTPSRPAAPAPPPRRRASPRCTAPPAAPRPCYTSCYLPCYSRCTDPVGRDKADDRCAAAGGPAVLNERHEGREDVHAVS